MVRGFARDEDLTDNQEGKVDALYLAEVEAQTERRVREFLASQRRLEAAQKRHARAVAAQAAGRDAEKLKRATALAWELVEERTRELRVLAGLMTEVPAPRVNRGSGQARHVSA